MGYLDWESMIRGALFPFPQYFLVFCICWEGLREFSTFLSSSSDRRLKRQFNSSGPPICNSQTVVSLGKKGVTVPPTFLWAQGVLGKGRLLSPVTEMVHPSIITDLLPVGLSFSGFFFFFFFFPLLVPVCSLLLINFL